MGVDEFSKDMLVPHRQGFCVGGGICPKPWDGICTWGVAVDSDAWSAGAQAATRTIGAMKRKDTSSAMADATAHKGPNGGKVSITLDDVARAAGLSKMTGVDPLPWTGSGLILKPL